MARSLVGVTGKPRRRSGILVLPAFGERTRLMAGSG
jgi:hypothetical protein